MTTEERIARINELSRASKVRELTPEEKEEQARLRKEYMDIFRGNLRSQLESIEIERPDGTVEYVKDMKKNK